MHNRRLYATPRVTTAARGLCALGGTSCAARGHDPARHSSSSLLSVKAPRVQWVGADARVGERGSRRVRTVWSVFMTLGGFFVWLLRLAPKIGS